MTPRYNRAKEMTPSSGINRTTVEDPGIPASQRRILADRATETLSGESVPADGKPLRELGRLRSGRPGNGVW